MTSLLAKHDAFGGGELRDGMGANSPSELVNNREEEEEGGEKVREYGDITKHSQQQNQLSLSQVKTTEQSSDDSDEQNQGEPSGPPQHAGFWDQSMVNVRMHVIKLWARDGKIDFSLSSIRQNWGGNSLPFCNNPLLYLSSHSLHRHNLGPFLLRSRLLPHTYQPQKTHRLRCRL